MFSFRVHVIAGWFAGRSFVFLVQRSRLSLIRGSKQLNNNEVPGAARAQILKFQHQASTLSGAGERETYNINVVG